MEQEIIIPFGKYKGKPLTAMAQDSQYLEWVQSQGWLAEKYPQINTLIINNFKEPSETPDHNRIQGMFLDEDFIKKFIIHYANKDNSKKTIYISKNITSISNPLFEYNAIDVTFYVESIHEFEYTEKVRNPKYEFGNNSPIISFNELQASKNINYIPKPKTNEPEFLTEIKKGSNNYDLIFSIEIKPCVGDDYPAILRQIRSLKSPTNHIKILLINEYNGVGISEENFIKLFKTQGITVLFIRDIL